jgi:CheY-like chemotaxis protein
MNTTLRAKSPVVRRVLRILYADDMQELRTIARIALGTEGHVVECVEDGALAYERVAADLNAYDIIISDHHMPNMTGLELVRRLRELGYPGKIIIFSSELSTETADAYQDLEVDRLLFKPIEPSVLRKLVLEV